ncbi:hypothetical protein EP227_03475 [bacterium]|nr:MAG: hypothetical protein EP227_03475 [bacterium]
MKGLTRKEIIAELRRLGINSIPDLKKYLREYRNYNNGSPSLSQQEVILKEWKKVTSYLKNNTKRNDLS